MLPGDGTHVFASDTLGMLVEPQLQSLLNDTRVGIFDSARSNNTTIEVIRDVNGSLCHPPVY